MIDEKDLFDGYSTLSRGNHPRNSRKNICKDLGNSLDFRGVTKDPANKQNRSIDNDEQSDLLRPFSRFPSCAWR